MKGVRDTGLSELFIRLIICKILSIKCLAKEKGGNLCIFVSKLIHIQ